MLLQFAVDSPSAFAVIPSVASQIDIIEVGTPLLKRFGLSAIATASQLSEGRPVLADTKTMDGGAIEAAMAFGAGARFVTVLGVADKATLSTALEAAEEADGYVVLDTIGMRDPLALFSEPQPTRLAYVLLHSGYDMLNAGSVHGHTAADQLATLPGRSTRAALAGGVTASNIDQVVAAGADLIIVGSGLAASSDPAGDARAIRSSLLNPGSGWPWQTESTPV